MILKRKIYSELLDWKNKSYGRSALLIEGARRIGKSFICEEFGKNEYKSTLLIDFNNTDREVIGLFEHERANLDTFFTKLSAFYGIRLYKRDSLIIFDEVQKYPLARQHIKYLVADGRYDYIETGSLISLKQNVRDITIPSEERHIEMFPLDFEEFLWALGNEATMPFICQCFEQRMPLGQALHRKIMNDFRLYMLIGGMPQAVLEYIRTKDLAETDSIKRQILTMYRDDAGKYAGVHSGKVRAIFNGIPGQLSKPEKKYRVSSLKKGARMRDYESAFIWLNESMMINSCYNATDPSVGLGLSADYNTMKIYMADTGLLVTQAFADKKYQDNNLYRSILFDKLHINEGMIMENIVAQMLRMSGHSLYFYKRADKNNRANMMEIDFLVSRDNKICPVEVKSSAYKEHSSLDKFRRKFSSKLGDAYIFYPKDLMIKDGVIHLPLYMAMLL